MLCGLANGSVERLSLETGVTTTELKGVSKTPFVGIHVFDR